MEILLAEKLETAISCDIYSFMNVHKSTLDENIIQKAKNFLANLENNLALRKLWSFYQSKFYYAAEAAWKEIMDSVRNLYNIGRINIEKK